MVLVVVVVVVVVVGAENPTAAEAQPDTNRPQTLLNRQKPPLNAPATDGVPCPRQSV